jgi:hypothetical protein
MIKKKKIKFDRNVLWEALVSCRLMDKRRDRPDEAKSLSAIHIN